MKSQSRDERTFCLPSLSGVLSAIGNTPLVKLVRLFPQRMFQCYGKLEMANPGGSSKDRSALGMLLDAYERREVGPKTTIIESSSGNLGIGLAQVCRYLELPFVCVVDTRTTGAHLAILQAYGARVEVVAAMGVGTNDLLSARLQRVQELRNEIVDSFWVNQYANLSNPRAQYEIFREIHMHLGDRWDYVFLAVSTCGTLRGCRNYIQDKGLRTRIVAVDAEGSIIFGDSSKRRLIPGHGASRVPELYRVGLQDIVIKASDQDCVAGCFKLLQHESIFAGGSSGAVVSAITTMADQISKDAVVVAILFDRGERYLDTIYSRRWIQKHFGKEFRPWEMTTLW